MKRGQLITSGIILFLLFVFFSYLVHKNVFTNFDFNATVKLQDKIPHRLDEPFSQLSQLGNFEVMTGLLVIVLLLRKKLWGIVAFIAYVGFHLFEIYGKNFVEHPPPPQFMVRVDTPVDFPKFTIRTENSYPSGHAGRTIFISLLLLFWVYKTNRLSQLQKNICYAFIISFDVLMFISRPYLGEHWTSDVIGGILLGAGLSLLSEAFLF